MSFKKMVRLKTMGKSIDLSKGDKFVMFDTCDFISIVFLFCVAIYVFNSLGFRARAGTFSSQSKILMNFVDVPGMTTSW